MHLLVQIDRGQLGKDTWGAGGTAMPLTRTLGMKQLLDDPKGVAARAGV